jgi:hypothetical protein
MCPGALFLFFGSLERERERAFLRSLGHYGALGSSYDVAGSHHKVGIRIQTPLDPAYCTSGLLLTAALCVSAQAI